MSQTPSLNFQPSWGPQVPFVQVPGGRGYFDRFFVGFGDHKVIHQANLGLFTLGREGSSALVLLPQFLIPLYIGVKAVQVAHDD